MRVTVVVNDGSDLKPDQTTTLLIETLLRRGHRVQVAGVTDLTFSAQRCAQARIRSIKSTPPSRLELVQGLREARPGNEALDSEDLILIRTNPARDERNQNAHLTALAMLGVLRDRGQRVLNDPVGLMRASSKFYLQTLPAHLVPRTLVSADRVELREFVRAAAGPVVFKPVQGTRGDDVFVVRSLQEENLAQVIEVVLRRGFAVAQDFVPEAVDGDTRIILLEGKPLQIDGHLCAVRRVPSGRDFRSNVHVGGQAQPAKVDAAMRSVADEIAPRLHRDGLFLTGLDLIGNRIVEVNAYSPGGFVDAQRFEGVDFAGAVVHALERGRSVVR